jgi:hypothetical protein
VPIKPSADDPDPGPLYNARHNARDPRPATLGATRRTGPNLAYLTAAHGIGKLASSTATVSPTVATPTAAFDYSSGLLTATAVANTPMTTR